MRGERMNLHGLRLFYEVAKQKSVTQAAKKLAISQPAVTAQIKKFQEEENVMLLIPDGRGIQLTSIGQEVYQEAQKLFAIEKTIENRIQAFTLDEQSLIKLSGNYVTINYLVPQWLAEFKNQYKAAVIQVDMLNTADAVGKLVSNQVDFAFIGEEGEKYAEFVELRKIGIDEFYFVVAPEHKYANKTISLVELAKESFIGREAGSYTRTELASLFEEAGVAEPIPTLHYNGVHEAVTAVALGYGIHFCSGLVVAKQIKNGELARIYTEEPTKKRALYLCTRKKDKLNGMEQLFLDFLIEKLPND